jgi:hypothetical protein
MTLWNVPAPLLESFSFSNPSTEIDGTIVRDIQHIPAELLVDQRSVGKAWNAQS